MEAEEAGSQVDANENEEDAKNGEKFDPWGLPEFQDVGPKWSGKIASIFLLPVASCLSVFPVFTANISSCLCVNRFGRPS